MGSFEQLEVGDRTASGPFDVVEEDVEVLVARTGYVHPLFVDPAYAAQTSFGARPLPGQLVLAVMGGLAEQTDIFDDTVVALVGIEDARFHTAALPGDVLHLELEVQDKQRSESGTHGTVRFTNRCTNQRGELVASAVSILLFRCEPDA